MSQTFGILTGSKCIGWMHVCSLYCTLLTFPTNICTTPKIDNPLDISFCQLVEENPQPSCPNIKIEMKIWGGSIAKLTIRIVSFHQLDEDINWSFLSIVRDWRKNCCCGRTCSPNSNSVNSQSQVTGRWTNWSCHCSLCGMIVDKKNMRCQCTKNLFVLFVDMQRLNFAGL